MRLCRRAIGQHLPLAFLPRPGAEYLGPDDYGSTTHEVIVERLAWAKDRPIAFSQKASLIVPLSKLEIVNHASPRRLNKCVDHPSLARTCNRHSRIIFEVP
jgi:hypothetical protein